MRLPAPKKNQVEFPSLLLDTLFGLVLYFCLDYFLDITNWWHLIFYLSSLFVVVHWWMIFKSTDDMFGLNISNSFVDIILGIIYLILIEMMVLQARVFDVAQSIYFLLAVFIIDLIWALIWFYVGHWNTGNKLHVKAMNKELKNTMLCDVIVLCLYIAFCLSAFYFNLSTSTWVVAHLLIYSLYIYLTFKTKVIDLKFF